MDDRLIEHGLRAGANYIIRGNRIHGSDVAPAIGHVGHKMAQIGRYAKLAETGYRLGKKLLGYKSGSKDDSVLSQKKKMAPTKRGRSTSNPYPTPKKGTRRSSTSSVGSVKVAKSVLPQTEARRSASGTSNGKSGGFIAKPKRQKKTKLEQHMKTGIVLFGENGGSIENSGTGATALQSVTIGHATNSFERDLYLIACGFVKLTALRAGFYIDNFDTFMCGGRECGLDIWFREQLYTTNEVNKRFDIPTTKTVGMLVTEIFNWLVERLRGTSTTEVYPWMRFTKLILFRKSVATTPNVGDEEIFRVDLRTAKIDIDIKSALKVQNRSVNSANTDEDAVDNVPLYGKSYGGAGNYAFINQTPLAANHNAFGLISVGNYASSVMAEPPLLRDVYRASKSGKCKLEPGEIQTSVLSYQVKIPLNTFIQKFRQFRNVNASNVNHGKFRFMVLEKMIQSVATATTPINNGIKIHYEIDYKAGVTLTAKKEANTTPAMSLTPL